MTFRNTIEIDRPIDEVFTFISNFENVPKWNYAVQETKEISDGGQIEGKKYWQKREFLGREIEDTYEVSEYKPNERITIESNSGPFPFQFQYSFVEEEEKTKLINDIHLEPKGVFKIMDKQLQPRVKKAVAGNLTMLKQLLERN